MEKKKIFFLLCYDKVDEEIKLIFSYPEILNISGNEEWENMFDSYNSSGVKYKDLRDALDSNILVVVYGYENRKYEFKDNIKILNSFTYSLYIYIDTLSNSNLELKGWIKSIDYDYYEWFIKNEKNIGVRINKQ